MGFCVCVCSEETTPGVCLIVDFSVCFRVSLSLDGGFEFFCICV